MIKKGSFANCMIEICYLPNCSIGSCYLANCMVGYWYIANCMMRNFCVGVIVGTFTWQVMWFYKIKIDKVETFVSSKCGKTLWHIGATVIKGNSILHVPHQINGTIQFISKGI